MQQFECTKCGLYETRKSIVRGRGDIDAKIVFIGEAPGKDEDRAGLAFIGKSGELLEQMISEAIEFDLNIRPKIFITNTCWCRPCDYASGPNRQPNVDEIIACKGNVLHLIEEINPKVIIFLGEIAEKYYRNFFKEAFKLHHPAYLLRTGGKSSPYYIDQVNKLKEIFLVLSDKLISIEGWSN